MINVYFSYDEFLKAYIGVPPNPLVAGLPPHREGLPGGGGGKIYGSFKGVCL